jgi:CBS domain containing-hemolysin-like protein
MTAVALVIVAISIISFLCSLWEAALQAVPDSHIEGMRERGESGAVELADIRLHLEESCAAIIMLRTLARTLGGAIAGGMVVLLYSENAMTALVVFACLLTVVLVILTEVVPRAIGTVFAIKIAPLNLPFIRTTILFMRPLVKFGRRLTSIMSPESEEEDFAPTEDEILALARIGAEKGTLSKEEALWASNALLLDGISVRELMTPRTVVYLLPEKLPLTMVKAHSSHWTHSRLPVCAEDDPDRILGIIYRREVFDALVQRSREELEKMTLRDLRHDVTFIPDTMRGNEVLRRMLKDRQQFYVVTNEFGTMEGIITLEDVLEFLLGEEIVDPHDEHEDMQEYARRLAAERRKRVVSRPAPDPSDALIDPIRKEEGNA